MIRNLRKPSINSWILWEKHKETLFSSFKSFSLTIQVIFLVAFGIFVLTKLSIDAESENEADKAQDLGIRFYDQQVQLLRALNWIKRVTHSQFGNQTKDLLKQFSIDYSKMAFPNASDLVLREIHFNQEFTYQNVALQFISCMLLINLRRMKFSADIGHTLSAVAPIFGTFLFVVIIASTISMLRQHVKWLTSLLYYQNKRLEYKKRKEQARNGLIFALEKKETYLTLMQEFNVSLSCIGLALGMGCGAGYILMQENAWTFNESLRFSMGLFTGIGDIWSAPRSLMAKEITYWRCVYFCALMLWYSTGMSLILGSFFEIIVACKFASYRISELKKDELTYMKSLWKSRHELKYKA